jgi:alpha-glucosidase (family GH31 glycosyl hydrolase)
MMQFSAAPWRLLDAEYLEYCRSASDLHARLGDEILALAKASAQTGEPIMRSMEYVFPANGYEQITDQFMLGDTLLCAPVLQKGAVARSIQFPIGTWIGEDGSHVEGPCRIEVPAPLARIPHYRKEE